VEKAIRSLFVQYFPNPEALKKRRVETGRNIKGTPQREPENPYRPITGWFDAGNKLDILVDSTDSTKITQLYKVDGLHAFVKKHYNAGSEKETALLMEFVLHGLAAYSLISKKTIEGRIEFKDLMGSMLNLGSSAYDDDELTDEDFT
jgi:magnesium chelatase subunit I